MKQRLTKTEQMTGTKYIKPNKTQVNSTTLTTPLKDNHQDTGGTNKHRTQGNTRADHLRLGHGRGRDTYLGRALQWRHVLSILMEFISRKRLLTIHPFCSCFFSSSELLPNS